MQLVPKRNLSIKGLRHLFCVSVVKLGILILLTAAPAGLKAGYVEKVELPSFGKGKIQIRLYTDYFCGPCSRMEPKVEDLLSDLVGRNVITLIFVDTPVHKTTTLYAKYFLYVLNVEHTFNQVLRSRAVLFEAAKSGIEESEKLEEHLKKNGVRFKTIDPTPTFAALSALMNEDGVRSTPTCVIIREGKKSVFSGDVEITKALQLLN
jgi:protein-disulfide isomerase